MAYRLEAITLCTRGPVNTSAMRELWGDIEQGKLPILFDSEHNFAVGISPVLKYSDYSVDDKSQFTLSILGVTKTFFYALEQKAQDGIYKKYDYSSDTFDLEECSKRAWECVNADQANGIISRAFTDDFESTVPKEYTKDGRAHCYLYISIVPKH